MKNGFNMAVNVDSQQSIERAKNLAYIGGDASEQMEKRGRKFSFTTSRHMQRKCYHSLPRGCRRGK